MAFIKSSVTNLIKEINMGEEERWISSCTPWVAISDDDMREDDICNPMQSAPVASQQLKDELDAFWMNLRNTILLRNEFKAIYWNDEYVGIINERNFGFFKFLFDEIYDLLIIHACRITDNKETNGRGNLTVDRFLHDDFIKGMCGHDRCMGINENRIIPARREMLDVRNKFLAHKDFEYNVDLSGKRRPGFKYIDCIIDACFEIYGYLSVRVNGYDKPSSSSLRVKGGANYVFEHLKNSRI